jgi:tetratricopeptide (TPR) repeat protein
VSEAAFERIERIRQTAVSFRKEESSRAQLERELNALDLEQTLHLVRAFSYFSHLLNIAEDEQQHRRRRAHAAAGSPRRPGSFSYALERAREAGPSEQGLLDLALVAHLAGDTGAEVSACEQATTLAPESGGSWSRLAHALARTDRTSECLGACERALELGDDAEVRDLRERVLAAAPRELTEAA